MERFFCSERFFVVELVVKDFLLSLRFLVGKAELSGSGDRHTRGVAVLGFFFFFSVLLVFLVCSAVASEGSLLFSGFDEFLCSFSVSFFGLQVCSLASPEAWSRGLEVWFFCCLLSLKNPSRDDSGRGSREWCFVAFQNQERSFLRGEELGAEVGLLRQGKGVVFSSGKGMQAQETSWDLQQKVVRQEKLPGFVFF